MSCFTRLLRRPAVLVAGPLVLWLAAGLLATPARAEGGAFPSLEAMALVGLGYLLLVTLLVSGAVCGVLRIRKRSRPFHWGRIFGTALLIWVLGLVAMAAAPSIWDENTLLWLAGASAFAGACAVGFRGTQPITSI